MLGGPLCAGYAGPMNEQDTGTTPAPPTAVIDPDSVETEGPDLYSPWAAASITLMLISFGGCLVTIVLTLTVTSQAGFAMFALPVVSLLAVVAGVIGLMQTARAGGRIGGRNAAIMGAVVGIMLLALQSSVVLGALLPWFATGNNVQPAMERLANAASSADTASFRAALAPASDQLLRDEDIAAFWSRAAPRGSESTAPVTAFDLAIIPEARGVMAAASNASSGDTIDETMFPVRFEWSDGTDSIAWAYLDAEALGGNSVMIVDVLIVNSAGEAVALLPDGPAKKTAQMVGWTIR